MRGSRARFVRAEARRLKVGYRWLKRRWVRTPHAQRESMLTSAVNDWYASWSREAQARWRAMHPPTRHEAAGLWAKMRAVYERMKLKHTYDR